MGWLAKGAGKAKGGMDLPALAEPMSPNLDPYGMQLGSNHLLSHDSTHEGSGADYDFFRATAATPYVGVIHSIRINQAMYFLRPRTDDLSPGFRVRLIDPDAKMTAGAKKDAKRLMKIVMQGAGGFGDYHNFADVAQVLLRDSLTFDQSNAEILHAKVGGKELPYGVMPLDAALCRMARPTAKQQDSGKWYPKPTDKRYVKLWRQDYKIAAEYTPQQMMWGIRRRRSDEWVRGYGYPEIEEAQSVLTDILDAQTFNSVNFKSGIHANTVLAIHSTMKGDQVYSFKNAVRAMLTGRRQAQKVPLFFLKPDDKVQGIPLGKSNKDMEFSNYMNFLLKVFFACYQMDPAEAGFVMGAEGVSSALSTSGPYDRIMFSKERGLRWLLASLQWWYTSKVIRPHHPEMMLEFVGFDSQSDEARHKSLMDSARVYRTPNEVRDMYDLPRLDAAAADVPLDQAFREAAMGGGEEPGEGDAGMMGEGMPEGMPGGGEGPEIDPFAKGLRAGFSRESVSQWTEELVNRAEGAMDAGTLARPERSAGLYRMIPGKRPGILGHLVAVKRSQPWRDPLPGREA